MESQRPAQLPPRGLPILSGLPPVTESTNCRQCNKDFNPLWRRKNICGHCGYEYCSSCLSDGQALMPRRPGQAALNPRPLSELKAGLGLDDKRGSSGSGYEAESVCLPCLSMLQVTAAPVTILRSLPIKRLKDYLAAYNIPCIGAKEKEDIVQTVLKARSPSTGCLSPEAESYYRRRSVPKGNTQSPSSRLNNIQQSRPITDSDRPSPSGPQTYASSYQRPSPHVHYRPPPPPPPPNSYRHTSPRQQPQTQPRPQTNYGPTFTQARPPPRPAASPTPPPPVPSIHSLVALPDSYLSSLSIGTLKAILYENHVRVDFKQVLEKKELIARVKELVDDERKRLERQRIAEQEGLEQSYPISSPQAPISDEVEASENTAGPEDTEGDSDETPKPAKKVPTGPMPEIERGLCVVCQDEEATLAAVDCGHLCMCPHCSDLIMATTQECPLCRTRIVTKQRLIRIYRT
ncbi:hypothetical protein AYX15_05126 [Cryptococcus neoformans]|nr:hypothetical protein AYX15_05126 [Cryptococcus neoformans var. grubii]